MRRVWALSFSLLMTWFAFASASEVIVIAHRGACGYLPEHTLEAYALAYGLGADFIEPDLVLTSDGVLIALHDTTLDSTTDVAEVFPGRAREDGRFYAIDFTLEEIKQLRVQERRGADGEPAFPNRFPQGVAAFEIPTHAELIELVQGMNHTMGRNVGIYPELKAPAWHAEEGMPMEEILLAELTTYGYEGPDARVFVQSFEFESLERLRELGTELPLVMLIWSSDHATEEAFDRWATVANGVGPWKGLVEASPEIVGMAHERGMKVHPWTFRADVIPDKYPTIEQELATYFGVYLVDGVFTDFVDDAVRVLRGMGLR